ncbi:MAG TPA: hypothetical protein VMB80_10500 [Candidatus Acidoferrum sp.]|nr:hypothetical protein [Candidatus Acidoferrum sp.]
MKKSTAIVAILLLAVAVVFIFSRPRPPAVARGKTGAEQAAAVANALATASPQATAAIASNFAAPPQRIFYPAPSRPLVAPAGQPQPLEYTNLAPGIVLDSLRHAIRDYGSKFGGNPVGVNAEITRQLSGDNPQQVNFISPEAGMRLNDQGELVDPWGTPYFFHQLSGAEMEIRSAGPDKIMWTDDDLVTR